MKTFTTFISVVGALSLTACTTVPVEQDSTPQTATWGEVLAEKLPNCISKRDRKGAVFCMMDTKGELLGTSVDGLSVVNSDAAQACLITGGRLPTREEFAGLDKKNPKMTGKFFWSSSINTAKHSAKTAYFYNGTTGDASQSQDRSALKSVRCILRPH